MSRWLLVVLFLVGPTSNASGHEYWLSTSTWRCAPGETVVVRSFAGTGFRGELKPYTPKRVVRFTLEGARPVDLTTAAVNGDMAWARITPADAAGAVVCYESNGTYIELPAPQFDQYLALEGLSGPLETRKHMGPDAGPGRELYRRASKLWVAGSDPRRITRAYGLPLELVPEQDPVSTPRVGFRLLYEGKPLGGALVRAWRRPAAAADTDSLPPAKVARTDPRGHVSLDLRGDGRWLVSAVHMAPSPDRAAADWQSTWASLTFFRAMR